MRLIVIKDLTLALGSDWRRFAIPLLSCSWLATVDRLVREDVDGTG
jgi:hypothetical protein